MWATHLHSTSPLKSWQEWTLSMGSMPCGFCQLEYRQRQECCRREISGQYILRSFPVESSGTGHVSLPTSASSAHASSLFHSLEEINRAYPSPRNYTIPHVSLDTAHTFANGLFLTNVLRSSPFESTICFWEWDSYSFNGTMKHCFCEALFCIFFLNTLLPTHPPTTHPHILWCYKTN